MTAPHNAHFLKKLFKRGIRNRYLYTSKHKILKELNKRRKNNKHTEELLRKIKPTPEIQRLIDKPHVVFFRQVATPLHETLRVIRLASELGLDLCILEYHHDKFVGSHNPYKLGLGKLPIHKFVDKNGDDAYHSHTIVDFNTNTGKPLADVKTVTGESLVDFHHDFFTHQSGIDITTVSVDASNWFKQFSYDAKNYYESFLSLFVRHSILAEIFLTQSPDEECFIKDAVIPAFKKIQNDIGLKPLVLNYLPATEQDRTYWDCYPNGTDEFLKRKGYSK